jgi:predicted nucleic acid-binding protein
MIVVDASVVVEVLQRTPRGCQVERRLWSDTESLFAPHLLDLEVAQVFRRFVLSAIVDERRGREALQDLADLPLQRYPHDLLLPRVWELRQNLTVYDAVYVALAELLEAPLLTADRRLADAPGHSATIELV